MPPAIEAGAIERVIAADGIKVSRRRFLQAVGLTAIGAASASPLLAASHQASPASDPPFR